ncbi:MAG: hypothetical protein E7510_11815 [Ruminococcus sp.]|nr:hypothetical protein [Ruminococcus sp.]
MEKKQNPRIAKLIHLSYIFVWVITVTLAGHFLGIHSTWVYSLVVPIFFLMEGTEKDKVISIFCGGATGMVLTFLMCKAISATAPTLGSMWSYLIFVTIAIAILMLMMPFAHYFFNNVGFIYLIVSVIDTKAFCTDFVTLLISFFVGGAIYIGGAIAIVHFLKYRAKKKATAKSN